MADITYPLRALKHHFGKAVCENEGTMVLGSALLGVALLSGGIYVANDEMEDHIKSPQEPQASARITNEISALTTQKQDIAAIKDQISALEFKPSAATLYQLQRKEADAINSFEGNAKKTLNYILTNEHLSEQQIGKLWHDFTNEIIDPEEIGFYGADNYDFGFIKECRTEMLSDSRRSSASLAYQMPGCLRDEARGKHDAIFGIFGFMLIFPMLMLSGKPTIKKWAKEKPEKKPRSGFRH